MEDLCKFCCKEYYSIQHNTIGNSHIYHERDVKTSF